MTNKTDFKISPKYFASKWNELSLTNKESKDWQTAIDIFEDRIRGRFFQQVEALKLNKNRNVREFSGFIIVAIDCLLIETLEQFYRGVKRTGKDQDDQIFHDFFQRSEELKLFFGIIDKSKVFYSQIRCGLLHQAQTKKQSIIHIKSGTPTLTWIDINDIQKGISINRNKFHKAIEKVFTEYTSALRKGKDLNLRQKLKRKMNFIATQS